MQRARRGRGPPPTLAELVSQRAQVDAALLAALPGLPADASELVTLGCHHEEQHQEWLITDILHLMAKNPIEPAIWPGERKVPVEMPGPIGWLAGAARQSLSNLMSLAVMVTDVPAGGQSDVGRPIMSTC